MANHDKINFDFDGRFEQVSLCDLEQIAKRTVQVSREYHYLYRYGDVFVFAEVHLIKDMIRAKTAGELTSHKASLLTIEAAIDWLRRRGLNAECDSLAKELEATDSVRAEANGDRADDAVQRRRSATVNERMGGKIMEDPEAMGWNSSQWAKYLKSAKSSVVGTATWKKLESARRLADAERTIDRRRKPKASDSRRD